MNKLFRIFLTRLVLLIIFLCFYIPFLSAQGTDKQELIIKKSADFTLTGTGSSENWSKAEWIDIPKRTNTQVPLKTRAKLLYSDNGFYFLFDCQDKKLTSTMNADFMDLWKEDVVEIFLWTDEEIPSYFEYEISPLNYELPILIANNNGELLRWQPFHYEPGRKTSHATSVQGGEKKSNALVSGWMAEFFIPFKLLEPLRNNVPKSGSRWRGNLYRIDYDSKQDAWSWQLTTKTFHEYKKFGSFLFE